MARPIAFLRAAADGLRHRGPVLATGGAGADHPASPWAVSVAPVSPAPRGDRWEAATASGYTHDPGAAPAPDHDPVPPRSEDASSDDAPATTVATTPAAPTEPVASDEPAVRAPRFGSAQILAVANQKGGVGKTTTAVSLAAAMAQRRLRTLLIDLDPQGNASSGIGQRPAPGQPTIYDVLVGGDTSAEEAIIATDVDHLSLLPSNIDLAGAEIELVSAFSREQQLTRAIETVSDRFDIIVIDCPPSLGLLTINALTAAHAMVVPIQCEYYALEGLSALRRNADLVRSSLNRRLDILGFVLTMMDGRTRLSQQVVDEVKAHFGDKVFRTRIPRTVRLAEAPGFGQPITHFDPASKGAVAYRRLAGEVLDRLQDAADRAMSTSGAHR